MVELGSSKQTEAICETGPKLEEVRPGDKELFFQWTEQWGHRIGEQPNTAGQENGEGVPEFFKLQGDMLPKGQFDKSGGPQNQPTVNSEEPKFIDKDGNYVNEPHPTHYASGNPDELILYTSNKLVGFMKPNGDVAIEPQFEAGAPFSDGLACVRKGGLYGYINSEGEWIISPRFEYPNNFSEGLVGVPVNDKGWGFIDQNGNVVIPPKFGWIYGEFRHGLAEVAFDGEIGYINTKGEWVWEPSD